MKGLALTLLRRKGGAHDRRQRSINERAAPGADAIGGEQGGHATRLATQRVLELVREDRRREAHRVIRIVQECHQAWAEFSAVLVSFGDVNQDGDVIAHRDDAIQVLRRWICDGDAVFDELRIASHEANVVVSDELGFARAGLIGVRVVQAPAIPKLLRARLTEHVRGTRHALHFDVLLHSERLGAHRHGNAVIVDALARDALEQVRHSFVADKLLTTPLVQPTNVP